MHCRDCEQGRLCEVYFYSLIVIIHFLLRVNTQELKLLFVILSLHGCHRRRPEIPHRVQAVLLPPMVLEGGKLVVTLATLIARVQLGLGVNAFVQSPLAIPGKRGRTVLAAEGSIPQVDLVLVHLPVAALEVPLVAVPALEGLFLGVGQLMRTVNVPTGEGLWAEGTLERADGRVHRVHVVFEDALAEEGTTAEFTNERSLVFVGLSVVFEATRCLVRFVTLATLVPGHLTTVAAFVLNQIRSERVLNAAGFTDVLAGFVVPMARVGSLVREASVADVARYVVFRIAILFVLEPYQSVSLVGVKFQIFVRLEGLEAAKNAARIAAVRLFRTRFMIP